MKRETGSRLMQMTKWGGTLAIVLGFLTTVALNGAQGSAEREQALIEILKSPAAQQKEKVDACRELAVIGTKAAVPALSALLEDEKLSHNARYALEPIKDPSVDEAFRAALKKLKGRPLVGVIGSIGVRRDTLAVGALAGFLNDPDPDVAQAAARALGSIGTSQAAKALRAALSSAPEQNILAICEGLFRCAESLSETRQTKEALAIYDALREVKQAPHQVITGSVRGSILLRPSESAIDLLQRSLQSQDYLIFSAAVRTALEMKGEAAGKTLASALPKLAPDNQIVVLNAIAHRGDAVALPMVFNLAQSGEKRVRIAAIKAMGSIGSEKALPELVKLIGDSDSEISKSAIDVVAGFAGKGADSIVVSLMGDSEAQKRLIGIDLAGRRRMTTVLPTLVKLTSDPDANVRQSALKRIGELGSGADIDTLIGLLAKANTREEINAIEQALSSICVREKNQDLAANKVISALAGARPQQKGALLRVLSAISNQTALKAVREAVKDQNPQVRNDAIRALGDWKTADAAADLLELARAAQNDADKTLCLRNFFRLTGQTEISVEQRLNLCKKATEIVATAEEKKMLLGALGNVVAVESLDLIVPMLDNEAIANEAGAAVVSISTKLLQNKRNLNNQKIIQALQKTASAKVNQDISKQASSLLEKTKKQ